MPPWDGTGPSERADEPNGQHRAAARARGRTGGRPRTDVAKLENARILYEHSQKTAAEVCAIAGVGRRTFFAYLTALRKASE